MPTRPADQTGRPRLRVLTLVDGIGTHGGGESLARNVTERLDPTRFEPTYCVTRWEPRAEYQGAVDELKGAGVEFMGIERAARIDPRPFRPVMQRLRDGRVDILHSHKFGSNVWAAVLARLARPPVFVAHEHTWSYSGDRTRAFLDRRLIASTADAFIAVSRDDQRKMIEIEGIPRERTRFIPNGVEIETVANGARAEVRAELGIDKAQPVVGTVAALRPQKALHLLIEAVVILRREFPELLLVIAGGEDPRDPAEAARLRELVSRIGAEGFVRFLGIRDDIPRVLSAFDVAVFSSDYEGSPLSVLECMDAALPVVATSVGGVPDIVVDGATGLLVKPGDAQALSDGVRKLLADPALARRMGEAGRDRLRSEFTLAATVGRIEALYEELYDASVAGGGRD
jgi:glycosyltransferase involved in cell wall biosynthesis